MTFHDSGSTRARLLNWARIAALGPADSCASRPEGQEKTNEMASL
jgi:hypothetical protein